MSARVHVTSSGMVEHNSFAMFSLSVVSYIMEESIPCVFLCGYIVGSNIIILLIVYIFATSNIRRFCTTLAQECLDTQVERQNLLEGSGTNDLALPHCMNRPKKFNFV